jgi:hypothetical protein
MYQTTFHVAQVVNTAQLHQYIYDRNMVCFRYIIVHTLHKDDNSNDNNNNISNESSTEQNLSLCFVAQQQRWDTCQEPLTILIYNYYGHHTK